MKSLLADALALTAVALLGALLIRAAGALLVVLHP